MRIWSSLESDLPCPMTVADGRAFLTQYATFHTLLPLPTHPPRPRGDTPVLSVKDAWFRYEKGGEDVLRGLTLRLFPGELFCLLGGNGSGKTTTLSLLTGEHKPYRGTVTISGTRLAALPQNPQSLFLKPTLLEDLREMLPGPQTAERGEKLAAVCSLCLLGGLLHRHPYDLSGGEQQRAALAKVLLTDPDILLLDEPTKGLDADFKQNFAAILRDLTARGVAILMVSHDVEFCAEHADRCALFFDGTIVAEDAPTPFFSGKSFYTTAANRMARHLLPEAVTAEDVIVSCGGTLPPPPEKREVPVSAPRITRKKPRTPLPLWRRILAWISGVVFFAALIYSFFTVNLTELFTSENYRGPAGSFAVVYGVLIGALLVFACCVTRKPEAQPNRLLRGKLTRRTVLSLCLSLLAIPLTILLGIYVLQDRKYYVISLLILAETLLPFFLAFEGRKPQARELVILAVLCALGVAGRAAFVALPSFKPVTAMVIVSGVAFGGEAGFLVGAMTMFTSNMLFGQGPWTPWQMFAMGVIGLLAGVLFRKGLLRRDRLSLSVFGAVVTVLLYGGIMNPASVLMYQSNPTWGMIFTAYLTGVPVDLVHAAATVLFLWLLSEPMLQKLDRVKEKYGLMEGETP
ncbi:MAG: ECF transporter S component [Oscillospiraceae bacterium]|nr:ECF transporter S component [Oscillospiraceae bacterium]